MITAVAIIHEGIVYSVDSPKRHHHLIRIIYDATDGTKAISGEQGFLDDNGKYYNRENAGVHAIECGQIKQLKWPNRLFSEDLW